MPPFCSFKVILYITRRPTLTPRSHPQSLIGFTLQIQPHHSPFTIAATPLAHQCAQHHQVYDDDDNIPVATYDSDNSNYIMDYAVTMASLSSHNSLSLSLDHPPKPSQQKRDKAMQYLISIANVTPKWNSNWGPISNWSQKFTQGYISVVDENNTVAFIEAVAMQVQAGQQLMGDITHVITDCMLLTSEDSLKVFVQLMLKLIFRLNKGILLLEDRVHLFSSFPTN